MSTQAGLTAQDRRKSSFGNDVLAQAMGSSKDQNITVTEIISEGEIEGLAEGGSSIFVNGDPLFDIGESPFLPPVTTTASGATNTTAVTLSSSTPQTYDSEDGSLFIGVSLLTTTVSLSAPTYPLTDAAESTAGVRFTMTATDSPFLESMEHNASTHGNINGENLAHGDAIFELVLDSGEKLWGYMPVDGYGASANEAAFLSNRITAVDNYITASDYANGNSHTLRITIFYKVAAISGTTITLDSNPTAAFTDKNFYFQGAILASAYDFNKKYPNSSYQFRTGTLTQLPILGIKDAGTTSIALNAPGGNLEKDTAKTITSDALTGGQKKEVDQVRFLITYSGGLYGYDESNGKDIAMGVGYRVEVGINRGSGFTFTSAGGNLGPGQRNTSIGNSTETIVGHGGVIKTGTSFEFNIDLTPFQPFTDFSIRITRLTNHDGRPNNPLGRGKGSGTGKGAGSLAPFESDDKWKHVSTSTITSVSALINERLNYPHTALASLSFNSKQFSNVPRRSYEVKGLRVLVPSNYLTRDENAVKDIEYAGQVATYQRNVSTGAHESTVQAWDGNFRPEKIYTNNPAWVFYDILTNNRYGLGSYLSSLDIDKYALYKIGKYCDELVPDGKGGKEPRFTSNLYFQKATDAYKVLKDVATIFRGMLYWMDGSLTPVIDESNEPVYQFSKSNVIEGAFQYENTGSKTRANQYIISWNNPDSNYKLEPLIIEDRQNIIKTGKIIKESAVAFGCTSEGQAVRYGRWKLWTAINQTEIVSFETGINASFLAPGDIINISDSDDLDIPFSGRVSSYSESGGNFLTLDRNIDTLLPTSGYTYTVSVVVPKNVAILNQEAVTINGATVNPGDIVTTARVASGGSQTTLVVASEATTQLNISNALDDSNNSIDLILNTSTIVQERDLTGSTTIDGVANQVPAVAVDGRTKIQFSSALDRDNVSDLSEAIWAIRQKTSTASTLSSPKEYKILAIAESGEEGNFAITAVEHYNAKFDSVEEDFKLSVVDPIYPPEPRETPPKPKNLRILRIPVSTERGEEIRVQWDDPDNYDHLQHFLVTHNCTDNLSFVETIVNGNHLVLTNLRDNTYTIKVQAISRLGKKSRPISQNIQIVDIFGGSATRFNGILIGGVCSSALDINTTTGNVSFLKSSYAITPPQTPAGNISDGNAEAAVRSNNTNNASSKSQSVASLSSGSWTWYKTADDVREGRLFYDFSNVDHASNDPIRLIAWKRDATLDIEYWFDVDKYIANATSIWVNQSGTVAIAAGSNKVVGTNTSFTSLAVTRILKFSSTQAAKIAFIESDTVLYLDRSFTGAVNAGTTAQADELAIDFSEDFIIGSVTYNPNVSAGDRYKLKPNIVKNDTLVDNSRSVIVTPNLTSLIYDVSGAIKTKFTNINLKIQTVGFESPQISVTGATGFGQTDQSEDTGFASISSEPHTEVLHNAANDGANPPPYTYSGTAGAPLVFTVTIREEENTSITSTETITISKAQEAAGGGGSGILYLYKSNVNQPSIENDFPTLVIALTGNSAGQITGVASGQSSAALTSNQVIDTGGDASGWYTIPQSPTDDTHTVWITAATAANTGATDEIARTEWATPVKFSGADGAAGLNSATVELFQLGNNASSAPAGPTNANTLTYTFDGGALVNTSDNSTSGGAFNNWALTAGEPVSNNRYLWKISAAAVANTATDTIAHTEWSPPIIVARFAADALQTKVISIWKLSNANTTSTTVPNTNATITYSTGAIAWSDGEPHSNGWYSTPQVTTDTARFLHQRQVTITEPTSGTTVTVAGQLDNGLYSGSNHGWGPSGVVSAHGSTGKKSTSGYLYYNSQQADVPTFPDDNNVVITWSSGVLSGGVIGNNPGEWNQIAPAAIGGTSGSKMWYIYYSAEQSASDVTNNNTTSAVDFLGSTVYAATNFVGLVKFDGVGVVDGEGNSLSFGSGGSTLIHGDNITTGTIQGPNFTNTGGSNGGGSKLLLTLPDNDTDSVFETRDKAGNAVFKITKEGNITGSNFTMNTGIIANAVTIGGTAANLLHNNSSNKTGGEVGGWTINSTTIVGASGTSNITLDSGNKKITITDAGVVRVILGNLGT